MEKSSPLRCATSGIHSSTFRSGCPASSTEETVWPSYERSSILFTGSCVGSCEDLPPAKKVVHSRSPSSARLQPCSRHASFAELSETIPRRNLCMRMTSLWHLETFGHRHQCTCLVVPRKHIPTLNDVTAEDNALIGQIPTACACTGCSTNPRRSHRTCTHPGGVPPRRRHPARNLGDVETALHRRGPATVKDRQQAWNLARGGIPVVFVDFSADSATATAGRVKARWKTKQTTRTVGQLSPAPNANG